MSNVSSTPATPPGSARDTPTSEIRLQHYKARRDQLLRERRTQRAADSAYMEEYEGLVEELRTTEQKLMELAGRYGRPAAINPAYLAQAEAEAIEQEARRQGREGARAPSPPPEDPNAQRDETGRWVARSAAHIMTSGQDLDQGAGPSNQDPGTTPQDRSGTHEVARPGTAGMAGAGAPPQQDAKEEETPPVVGENTPRPAGVAYQQGAANSTVITVAVSPPTASRAPTPATQAPSTERAPPMGPPRDQPERGRTTTRSTRRGRRGASQTPSTATGRRRITRSSSSNDAWATSPSNPGSQRGRGGRGGRATNPAASLSLIHI